MGKKAAFLLAHALFVIFTYIIAILTIAAWLAGNISPKTSWFIAFMSLGMTPLLIINLLLFIWWVFKKKLLALLPLLMILLNIFYISAMVQVDLRSEESRPTPTLKIATYNVFGFHQRDLIGAISNIAHYLEHENVDIVCFQEFKTSDQIPMDTMRTLFPNMPYSVKHGEELAVFSKYPITDSDLIPFSETNSAMWADIDVNDHKIRVFNNHFQTTNFNQSRPELERFKHGINDTDGKKAFDVIMDRMYNNACKRSEQVDKIRAIMDTTSRSIIVCGDFNDTPASYTYKQIKKGLVDGFMTSGKGYAYTYQPLFKLLRLDYIFYGDAVFEGVRQYSPTLTWSDHKPVLLELAFRY